MAMTPYHQALHKCTERYRDMMGAVATPVSDHIWAFNMETMFGCRDGMPVPKLCRWLGYIQRALVERNLTTVEAERDWTRPLFRPLDFAEEAMRAEEPRLAGIPEDVLLEARSVALAVQQQWNEYHAPTAKEVLLVAAAMQRLRPGPEVSARAMEIISDEEIERVHANANFGPSITKREVVDRVLLQVACGFSTGHTAWTILVEHGLVPGKAKGRPTLTAKGRRYLWAVYGKETL
jgi:hypothetical protein